MLFFFRSSTSRLRMFSSLAPPTPTPTLTTTATATHNIPRPRLPIPPLRSTLDKYLTSIQPILLDEEARGGLPYHESYAKRVKLAQEFEQGIGPILHARLQDVDRNSPHNWLDDNYWARYAYLEGRTPLVVNSNWWLALHNDPAVPEDVRRYGPEDITPWQIRRASWMTHRLIEFKEKLLSQELHPDTTRTGLWLRDSTSNMFNVCRIPHPTCDTISTPQDPSHPLSHSIVVMVYDWFYSINMYPHASDHQIGPAELERRLWGVVKDAKARLDQGERAVPVGVLSADDRNVWAKNLNHLLSLSLLNHQTHRTILSSILHLSLDSYTHRLPSSPPSSSSTSTIDIGSTSELNAHLHNIRSGRNTARNRWFDKALTLIVESNSRAGAMGEHSPCDALVPSIVCEYACVESVDLDAYVENDHDSPLSGEIAEHERGWSRLDWVIDDYIRRECIRAEDRARVVIEDSDDAVLCFDEYGSQWIQECARLSPDAYIQLALQLAYYRNQGGFTAVYETALTRMFDRGRTETIRSYTTESRAFVLGMLDQSLSSQAKFTLLQRAVQTHTSLTRQATTGKGIDRHLLGLKLQQTPLEAQSNPFFLDPLFSRSQEWKLSTSGLSAGVHFRGTGFGTVYPDGYGINYLAAPDMIKFGIESKFSAPQTSTSVFQAEVVKALGEMKDVCLAGLEVVKSNL